MHDDRHRFHPGAVLLVLALAVMSIASADTTATQESTTQPATGPATAPATQPAQPSETQPATAPAASQPATQPEQPSPQTQRASAPGPETAAAEAVEEAEVEPPAQPEIERATATPPANAERGVELEEKAPKSVPTAPYLRISEDKKKYIALEIASRDFLPDSGKGPRVCLVAVTHIADQVFYDQVQALLDRHDVVLYESVKPPGTGGAGGETEEERIASTQAALQYIGAMIESYRKSQSLVPGDLAALSAYAAEKDARHAMWLKVALIDGWNNSIQYKPTDAAPGYDLRSLGADGRLGGEGANADIVLDEKLLQSMDLSKEDNLQVQMASALGLKFQLNALTYDKPNWRCSDMAMDEISRELAKRGVDFGPIGGTLAGSSLPAKIIGLLLNLMKILDVQGQVADTFKVVLIQVLGDPVMVEKTLMEQMGRGFREVIVEERNQRAIDDLQRIITAEPEVASVAILYGAAHMPDLVARLVNQCGYSQAEGSDHEHWFSAIKVDYTKSAVSAEELVRIRLMIRQMLRR